MLVLASLIACDLDSIMPWQRNDDLVVAMQVGVEVGRMVQARNEQLEKY